MKITRRAACALCLSLVIVSTVFLLSACAQAPQSVSDDISDYNSTLINGIPSSEVEFKPFSDVVASTETEGQSVGQFILKDIQIKLPSADAQYYNFCLNHRQCVPAEDMSRIIEEQFPDIKLEDYIGATEDRVVTDEYICLRGNSEGFFTDGRNVIRVIGLSGEIRLLHGKSLDYCNYYSSTSYENNGILDLSAWDPSNYFEAKQIIRLNSGEQVDSELSYELTDGAVKVADAMEYALSYLNNTFAAYEDNQFTYGIRKIYIRKIADGKYGYEFSAERLYNGVPIDSTPLYKYDGPDFGAEGYIVDEGDAIYVWMVEADSIDFFYSAARRTVTSCEACDSDILTLDSAFEILCNSLTTSTSFTVSSVELLYLNGYYADEYLPKGTEEDVLIYVNYPKDTRLVWAVLVKQPSVIEGSLESPHDPHYSLFVDAVTGEVICYYDNMAFYFY